MFERRLKIFLAFLVLVTGILVVRAAQVQVIQKDEWLAKAADAMKRSRHTETVRGRILDVNGHPIALDQPCIDACIDFRAISDPPDEAWLKTVAIQRLRSRMRDAYGDAPNAKKKEFIAAEIERVKADIASMWSRLERASGRPIEKIHEARDEIVNKVELRRRYIRYHSFKRVLKEFESREPATAWRRWLIGETANPPTEEKFKIPPIEEETQAHPLLTAINVDTQNELRKHIEDFPGLVLRPGVQRVYPYNDAACHLIGNLSRVNKEDLLADPNLGQNERRYYPSDLIGRTGLEKLAEPLLRGSRGRIDTIEGKDVEVGRVESIPGADVKSTIDIELQHDIANIFRFAKAEVPNDPEKKEEIISMHGAAVVIDVPTGELRALVSYPTYDLNEFNEKFPLLSKDDLNTPLNNRATRSALVPGSTVKPIVGIGAITDGLIGVNEGIECTGYLIHNGKKIERGYRCWTASKFEDLPPEKRPPPEHHQVPYGDPHVGHDGNRTGFLTFSDALQRSCNVYFETLGGELELKGLSKWYDRFGLGRPTGIGITESRGYLPMSYYMKPPFQRGTVEGTAWSSAIGQVQVAATPLQMANVAATIARGGIWVRPTLLRTDPSRPLIIDPNAGPDRVDLHLNPEAVAAAKEGMVRVVNTEAGTGKSLRHEGMIVAGKTGTATASPLKVKVRDEDGEPMLNSEGKPMEEFVRPSTPDNPNPEARWYRGDGKTLNHAWFIGFAPAENPKVAFAVMVEYGVSGGVAAGSVARDLLEACIVHRHLPKKNDVAVR